MTQSVQATLVDLRDRSGRLPAAAAAATGSGCNGSAVETAVSWPESLVTSEPAVQAVELMLGAGEADRGNGAPSTAGPGAGTTRPASEVEFGQ